MIFIWKRRSLIVSGAVSILIQLYVILNNQSIAQAHIFP